MSPPSENFQSKSAKGDHPYAFSPLPQEDDSDISSLSIEMPPSTKGHEPRGAEGGYPHTFYPPEHQFADEISTEFCSSQDNESACATYTKLAFIALVISYSILTYYLPSPTLLFNPNSFAISNFTIFYSRLAANWEAAFTFGCENCDYNLTSGNDHTVIYYDYIKGYIFYNDEEHKDVLSTASIEPFALGAREHKRVHVKFGNTGWEGNQPIVRKQVVNEIGKQVEHGMLHLGMRLDLSVTYKKWGSFWKGSLLELPDSYCWNLLVGVMPETGMGRLILSRPEPCYELYYHS
ncbi:hypothetical protein CRYUN_Cryun10bG0100700 [Craigia yunnanensis]